MARSRNEASDESTHSSSTASASRGAVDARAAQSDSPIALLVIDLLSDKTSALYTSLRLSDIFMFRRTCRAAWGAVPQEALTVPRLRSAAHGYGSFDGKDHHIPLLRLVVPRELPSDPHFFMAVGQGGDRELIDECLELGDEVIRDLFRGAAVGGRADVGGFLLDRLRGAGDQGNVENVLSAELIYVSRGGSVELAKLVNSDASFWRDSGKVNGALHTNQFSFVKWILQGATPRAEDKYVWHAAQSGSIELVEWLVENGWPIVEGAPGMAVGSGNIALVEWMEARGALPGRMCWSSALLSGGLAMVDWLYSRGYVYPENAWFYRAGDVAPCITKRLIEKGVQFDPFVLTSSACGGSNGPELFEWLIEQGLPFDRYQCMKEVTQGIGFDLPAFAAKYGVVVREGHFYAAVQYGLIDRVRYGLENGAVVSPGEAEVMLRMCPASLDEYLRYETQDGILHVTEQRTLSEAISMMPRPPSREALAVLEKYGWSRVNKRGKRKRVRLSRTSSA